MKKGRKRLLVSFWFSVLFLCPVFSAHGNDDLFSKLKIQPVREKKSAPDFDLQGLNGRKGELKNFRGKIVLLTFWATWCGPCKQELPSIEALHQRFREKGMAVLTVAVDQEGAVPVEKFMAKHGYTFHVLIDSKSRVLDLYRVEKIPMTFLIDEKGRFFGKAIGPRDWKSPDAISLFNQLVERNER